MKTSLVISGGDFSPGIFLESRTLKYDYCIAADKGYLYANRLGITPDVIIGDFDSYEEELPADVPVIRHKVEKDDTDTMLAIKYALENGYNHIVIVCALGGRLDHTLANIQSMLYAAQHGGVCEIYSDTEYLTTLNADTITIPKKDNHSLSVLALSDICEGVSISGAKYNVSDATLTNGFPLGFGNSWESDEVTVSVQKGILLIVQSSVSNEQHK